jgi:hypothetical protein
VVLILTTRVSEIVWKVGKRNVFEASLGFNMLHKSDRLKGMQLHVALL